MRKHSEVIQCLLFTLSEVCLMKGLRVATPDLSFRRGCGQPRGTTFWPCGPLSLAWVAFLGEGCRIGVACTSQPSTLESRLNAWCESVATRNRTPEAWHLATPRCAAPTVATQPSASDVLSLKRNVRAQATQNASLNEPEREHGLVLM